MSTEQEQHSEQSAGIEDIWYLKDIHFGPELKPVKIITQNFNGPCSLIAICNILLLRGHIAIQPPDRKTVSYELLSQLVADYLLTNCPGVDISSTLTVLPLTQHGMDLNPLFTSHTSFGGGQLDIFEQAGIKLVHGWLVDPETPEFTVISKWCSDYDSATNLIVEADHMTRGRLVPAEEEVAESSSNALKFSDEDKEKVEAAVAVRQFLESTGSQLTYHGLFHLSSTLPSDTLVALYRNLHLSVLYKDAESGSLYSLVTDDVFAKEPSVVWERMEDVDGGSSVFVDSEFKKSVPFGGDFAGQTEVLGEIGVETPGDSELARQLQEEEESQLEQERIAYQREQEARRQRQQQQQRQLDEQMDKQDKSRKAKKEKDCVIM